MKNLKDLFEHQLKDLYSAESQLLKALPDVIGRVKDEKLKKAIEAHMEETKEHKKCLGEICDELDVKAQGEECKAMKGLIEETIHFLKEDADPDVKDAGIIANCQRVEHYEISGYGTTVRYARELGYKDIADKLQKVLDQEYEADDKLNSLAENRLNEKAMS